MNTLKGNISIPIAIIVAGALIAGALYFALGTFKNKVAVQGGGAEAPSQQPTTPIRGVQADDHIIGNPDAKVVIVEFSDPECPFCKEQHNTLTQVTKDYDPSDVAWVYRHFPLPQLHSQAPKEAAALECAATLGGNDTFWKYTNRLYAITPSNNEFDLAELPKIAEETGLNVNAFNKCLDSGETNARVKKDSDEAWASGAQGTPHNIILVNGKQIAFPGMMRVSDLEQIIDNLLTQ